LLYILYNTFFAFPFIFRAEFLEAKSISGHFSEKKNIIIFSCNKMFYTHLLLKKMLLKCFLKLINISYKIICQLKEQRILNLFADTHSWLLLFYTIETYNEIDLGDKYMTISFLLHNLYLNESKCNIYIIFCSNILILQFIYIDEKLNKRKNNHLVRKLHVSHEVCCFFELPVLEVWPTKPSLVSFASASLLT